MDIIEMATKVSILRARRMWQPALVSRTTHSTWVCNTTQSTSHVQASRILTVVLCSTAQLQAEVQKLKHQIAGVMLSDGPLLLRPSPPFYGFVAAASEPGKAGLRETNRTTLQLG